MKKKVILRVYDLKKEMTSIFIVDEEEAKKQAASAAPKIEFVLHFIKEFFKLTDIPEFLKRLLFP